ncbi:MAG: copper amine oxidase N-terminal domain-containing protein [Peptococcaceae bacterium]|jgi:hypothetical protein|nr:copper amine oxidase N-terminal domain-containing protein [Peptococcaceae bacterium]
MKRQTIVSIVAGALLLAATTVPAFAMTSGFSAGMDVQSTSQTTTYMDYTQGSSSQQLSTLMRAVRNNPRMMGNYQQIGRLMDQEGQYGVKVFADGNQVDFNSVGVQPVIEQGRILMPVRSLMDALGGQVNWDRATRTVTAQNGNTTVTMRIGADDMLVNGRSVPLDVPAAIIGGRAMLPLRAMAQAMGMNVNWFGQSDMVVLISN